MLSNTEIETVDDILGFWFADIGEGFNISEQNAIWYQGGQSVDRAIEQQFGPWVESAMKGQLAHWGHSKQSILALVLLLDQFTRNIFRRSSKAFAGDELAREALRYGLSESFDKQMTIVQRSFFYMPFEHSELLSDQQQSVELFRVLLSDTPLEGKSAVERSVEYAIDHHDIVQRFGRFPHRNEVLERESSAEESAYLEHGGARFGQ